MRKKWSFLVLAVVLACSISACGKDKEETETMESTAVQTESAVPETETAAETETQSIAETESAADDNAKAEKAFDMQKGTVTAEVPGEGAAQEELEAYGVEAMKTAHFIGIVDKSVDKLLKEYKPDGSWSAAVNEQGEICVDFKAKDFTASFIAGMDGMFSLKSVTAGEEQMEGQEAAYYLEEVLGYEGK